MMHTPDPVQLGIVPSLSKPGANITGVTSLISYWAHATEVNRRTASYVDRILKGAKPGDLPIEQSAQFVANLRTARVLGFTFPQSVFVRSPG